MTVVDFWLVQVCFHRFVFPNNFGVNHTEAYNDAWNIRIHPSVTYYSANGSAVYTTTANITYGRIPPNMQLCKIIYSLVRMGALISPHHQL